MKFKLIAAMVAVIAVVGFSSVQAQDCGCGGGYGAYSGVVESGIGGYGSYGCVGYASPTCNRGISSSAASSLWAGYCTEDCSYNGPQRNGLFRRCKLRHGGGGGCGLGGGGGCGGCGGGCFSYPSGGCGCGSSYSAAPSYDLGSSCGGGCDTSYVSAVRGGHFGGGGCGLKQKLAAKGGCGRRGGCLTGGCGGGGGCLAKLKARHQPAASCGCAAPVSECSTCLSGACDSCGDCGGYFSEAIGYEYGNGGMQSYVGGSLTSACGCGGY